MEMLAQLIERKAQRENSLHHIDGQADGKTVAANLANDIDTVVESRFSRIKRRWLASPG